MATSPAQPHAEPDDPQPHPDTSVYVWASAPPSSLAITFADVLISPRPQLNMTVQVHRQSDSYIVSVGAGQDPAYDQLRWMLRSTGVVVLHFEDAADYEAPRLAGQVATNLLDRDIASAPARLVMAMAPGEKHRGDKDDAGAAYQINGSGYTVVNRASQDTHATNIALLANRRIYLLSDDAPLAVRDAVLPPVFPGRAGKRFLVVDAGIVVGAVFPDIKGPDQQAVPLLVWSVPEQEASGTMF
jgi:hypothetical protein